MQNWSMLYYIIPAYIIHYKTIAVQSEVCIYHYYSLKLLTTQINNHSQERDVQMSEIRHLH